MLQRDTSRQGKFLVEIIKELNGKLSHHHDNRNSFNRTSTGIDLINRIPIIAPILGTDFRVLFLRGHISLKNRSYCPLLRASTSPFKSTCLLIRLKEVPDRCMGRTYSVKRRTIPNYGRATLFNAQQRCRIEPGTCIMARNEPRLKIFIFIYTQINLRTLSIQTHALPLQIIPALNREGVELQFNQSYQFKLTTNPLGKHYINS
jgi:hypothetical protein